MKRQNKVTIGDLLPGDVLLSYGHGWLSDAIRVIDGGQYSHAGFYDGQSIVEATRAGIAYRTVAQDLKQQKYIHVYRYKGDKGEHLGDPLFPAGPPIDVARQYLKTGGNFAYHQLFLLALLAIFRRAPIPIFLKKLLRPFIKKALGDLNDVLQQGKQPVICSELLYRIFDEATPKHHYGLSVKEPINVRQFRRLATAPVTPVSKTGAEDKDAAKFERLSHELAQTYVKAKTAVGQKAPNPLVKADFVTPRDLEESKNLEMIGILS